VLTQKFLGKAATPDFCDVMIRDSAVPTDAMIE
jgi:hypothetical protein